MFNPEQDPEIIVPDKIKPRKQDDFLQSSLASFHPTRQKNMEPDT